MGGTAAEAAELEIHELFDQCADIDTHLYDQGADYELCVPMGSCFLLQVLMD